MRLLVTGAAGFIGYHTCEALLRRGDEVFGLDNLNAYYDVRLKEARLARLEGRPGFRFTKADLADRAAMAQLFADVKPERVVHLAAQAGVRYSLENPHAYADSNLVGFVNILEGCRALNTSHLVYASTSSVYGANRKMPFSVDDPVDHPLSLYAATKRANELMAHSYAHLYGLPVTGLRFFTVYGPWGRPDMAIFKFTRAMLSGEPIDVYNAGHHARDLSYIDDIVEGVVRTLDLPARPDPGWSALTPSPATSNAPYRLYNIGNNRPVRLLDLIQCLEKALGVKARMNLMPMQPGDIEATCADIDRLQDEVGFRPDTPLETGIGKFIQWFKEYYETETVGH
jgi:UDP-glucuronate 4-epimerase